MALSRKLHAFYNPEEFQGWGKKRKYFEGWYFKVVSRDLRAAYAFIPGIAFDEQGDGHAFVQVLDGRARTASYHKFGIEEFQAASGKLDVRIGNNRFSQSGFHIELPGISGEMKFKGNVGWPKPWYSPGIMGPFAYAPMMECYHGIVSMDHELAGVLTVEGEAISFDSGRGYCEKDWGRSFPRAYIWMQSNHFSEPGISLKSSVAKIPWVTGAFTGFIAGVWLRDRLIRFTTYNGTRLRHASVSEHNVHVVLQNRRYKLEIHAKRPVSDTELASPIMGAMDGRISESMTAEIHAILTDLKTEEILLNDTGLSAGLEVAGAIHEIATVVSD